MKACTAVHSSTGGQSTDQSSDAAPAKCCRNCQRAGLSNKRWTLWRKLSSTRSLGHPNKLSTCVFAKIHTHQLTLGASAHQNMCVDSSVSVGLQQSVVCWAVYLSAILPQSFPVVKGADRSVGLKQQWSCIFCECMRQQLSGCHKECGRVKVATLQLITSRSQPTRSLGDKELRSRQTSSTRLLGSTKHTLLSGVVARSLP